MNNKLFTYAFAKTLFEQKRDYIDTFYAFVLKTLPVSDRGSNPRSAASGDFYPTLSANRRACSSKIL